MLLDIVIADPLLFFAKFGLTVLMVWLMALLLLICSWSLLYPPLSRWSSCLSIILRKWPALPVFIVMILISVLLLVVVFNAGIFYFRHCGHKNKYNVDRSKYAEQYLCCGVIHGCWCIFPCLGMLFKFYSVSNRFSYFS